MARRKSVRLMDADAVSTALRRIAHEILENNTETDDVAIVGIRTRGVPIAERIAATIEELSGKRPEVGILDINLYRDDVGLMAGHPVLRKTEIEFGVDATGLVLVDDVLFTGRTIRAALDALMDLGRPAWVQLAVLVDRGHREVPIKADYVGKNIPTSRDQQVEVRVEETDGRDEVVVLDLQEHKGDER
ncbi:MAG: bifunctional pyr operon transcriptional regulator/uracil phosphoribosyltransferase PyrR [Acidobacteria bacterium]|nr:bifunctional pyr operon transcriptional regulator/uracil phosphoribosyltransferase PyrR [Acidobacteriota bacterium]NIM62972.1 bifunctional pyr operon transcriptional regulator/uracil phosphoribosyltransferase PyrR [Acidobacteriota bacterium]NIO59116.1 bifunctional pyr operon transcriptional regulator/uracil phosphoribosyltransferase PyrR [Acidobacteriota bacterium]NIQ30147.1 bifunctional pyr operon transcriptional regulator/uracil phosphoribosyltransferase PyrR [Acidobacteriota bacterium]NIQ